MTKVTCEHSGATFETKNGWVSVKDKLPEHEETVLVYTNKDCTCICIFVCTKKMNKVLRSHGYPEEQYDENKKPYSFVSQETLAQVLNGVTHWMHLPEPPK